MMALEAPRKSFAAALGLVALVALLHNAVAKDPVCYDTAPKPRQAGVLNVHLVCHTHDDVGWLKNVDEYFVGSRQDIYKAGVGYIIDSVVQNLQENPDRTFVYVEMAFFSRWWDEASEKQREAARTLVKNKQLTFANGGWCMHDEAAAHFVGMIDQTTRGHRFLMENFGYVPKTGWQLDPFGHSATQAYLLGHDLGFDAMVLGRSDHVDLEKRKLEKGMEMLWSPSVTFGESKTILTQIRPDGNYQPPPCFCFDFEKCKCDPFQDDENLEDYNVEQRVEEFIEQAILYNNTVLGDDILFLMGSDFQWENAHVWYKNLDKLIHYVNKDPRVNVFYSTPEDYFQAKRNSNITFPRKTDDFFPYSDDWHSYWTGYFTSRPTSKHYAYIMTSLLQSARQFEYYQGSSLKDSDALLNLENAVGIVMHHDAITGTERQAVADDYAFRLHRGSVSAVSVINEGLKQVLSRSGEAPVGAIVPAGPEILTRPGSSAHAASPGADFVQCPLLNVSSCAFTEDSSKAGQNFQVAVYNNMAQTRTDHVHVPIGRTSSPPAVFDGELKPVVSQITDLDPSVRSDASQVQDLAFAVVVPPKGVAVYYVMYQNLPQNAVPAQMSKIRQVLANEPVAKISGGDLAMTFDGASGAMTSIENTKIGTSVNSSIGFVVYNSTVDNSDDGQSSGAYIFRPSGTLDVLNRGARGLNLTMVSGPVFSEMRQTFSSWLSLSTRVYEAKAWADLKWRAGPLPIGDGLGKEVSLRISSAVQSGKEFYTDSNGREMLKRKLNYRPTWNLEVSEPVAGNYYPLTAALSVSDESSEMAVVLDRACGGTSLKSGDLEFMVHRRILADDGRGVGEPLNETECGCINCDCAGLRVAGTTSLVFGTAEESAQARRRAQAIKEAPLVAAFRPVDAMEAVKPLSGIQGKFPDNLSLMTFHALDSSTVLLRLAHMFQAGESAVGSKPATVDISTLFPGRKIEGVQEVSLSSNRVLNPDLGTTEVTVSAMQIRTFLVKHGGAQGAATAAY